MSPSFFQIVVVVLVVAVLFGGKRLRHLGGDLGTSLKGFKNAMKEDEPQHITHQEKVSPNIESTSEELIEK